MEKEILFSNVSLPIKIQLYNSNNNVKSAITRIINHIRSDKRPKSKIFSAKMEVGRYEFVYEPTSGTVITRLIFNENVYMVTNTVIIKNMVVPEIFQKTMIGKRLGEIIEFPKGFRYKDSKIEHVWTTRSTTRIRYETDFENFTADQFKKIARGKR